MNRQAEGPERSTGFIRRMTRDWLYWFIAAELVIIAVLCGWLAAGPFLPEPGGTSPADSGSFGADVI